MTTTEMRFMRTAGCGGVGESVPAVALPTRPLLLVVRAPDRLTRTALVPGKIIIATGLKAGIKFRLQKMRSAISENHRISITAATITQMKRKRDKACATRPGGERQAPMLLPDAQLKVPSSRSKWRYRMVIVITVITNPVADLVRSHRAPSHRRALFHGPYTMQMVGTGRVLQGL